MDMRKVILMEKRKSSQTKSSENINQITYGRNTEGYLCVWDGQGTMHYASANSEKDGIEITTQELTQAKILTMLFRIAKRLGVDRKL